MLLSFCPLESLVTKQEKIHFFMTNNIFRQRDLDRKGCFCVREKISFFSGNIVVFYVDSSHGRPHDNDRAEKEGKNE